MRMRTAFLGVVCVSWAFAQACGGDSGVDLDGSADGTTGNDVVQQPDTSGNDVAQQQDTGTNDTGPGDDGSTTTDASDGGAQQDTGIAIWKCGSAQVTDCSQCVGYTQPCAYCLAFQSDAAALTGTCVQTGTNCLNSIPQGYQDCPCNADASACPESFQVCTQQGRCHTCTDSTQNSGLQCENGQTCAADAGCM
jgi:hypothetical protein